MTSRFRDVWQLVSLEMSRTWASYIGSALFMLVMGMLVTSPLEAIDTTESFIPGDSFSADLILLLLATLLATNFMSRDYFSTWRDPITRRLVFFRSLPIPADLLVSTRITTMFFALVITTPALFVPIYLLGGIDLNGGEYVSFVLIWVAYSLVWAGLSLYIELSAHGLLHSLTSFVGVGVIAGFAAAMAWVFEISIVATVADLARDYGIVASLLALIVGLSVFALFAALTNRTIRRREWVA